MLRAKRAADSDEEGALPSPTDRRTGGGRPRDTREPRDGRDGQDRPWPPRDRPRDRNDQRIVGDRPRFRDRDRDRDRDHVFDRDQRDRDRDLSRQRTAPWDDSFPPTRDSHRDIHRDIHRDVHRDVHRDIRDHRDPRDHRDHRDSFDSSAPGSRRSSRDNASLSWRTRNPHATNSTDVIPTAPSSASSLSPPGFNDHSRHNPHQQQQHTQPSHLPQSQPHHTSQSSHQQQPPLLPPQTSRRGMEPSSTFGQNVTQRSTRNIPDDSTRSRQPSTEDREGDDDLLRTSGVDNGVGYVGRPTRLSDTEILFQQQWIFSKTDLADTPSRRDGISEDDEWILRFKGCKFISSVGLVICNRWPRVVTVACTYFHRFFMRHSFRNFPYKVIAATCLYITTSMEDYHTRLSHIVGLSLVQMHKKRAVDHATATATSSNGGEGSSSTIPPSAATAAPQPSSSSSSPPAPHGDGAGTSGDAQNDRPREQDLQVFEELRTMIRFYEGVVLETICFDFVDCPLTMLMDTLQPFYASLGRADPARTVFINTCQAVFHDVFQTVVCVQHDTRTLAVATLLFVLLLLKMPLKLPGATPDEQRRHMLETCHCDMTRDAPRVAEAVRDIVAMYDRLGTILYAPRRAS